MMMCRALKISVLIVLLLLSVNAKSQITVADSVNTCRVRVSCSLHGVTFLNTLDTYMSGFDYHGTGYSFNHENFRDARSGNYKWKYQTLFGATVGMTKLYDSYQYVFLANRYWSGYHPFRINRRLQLLAGAQMQLAGGALYIPTNGNNLVSAKLRTSLAATGMAIYRIPLKNSEIVTRYQLDIPLVGFAFSPEFGESYYEIFGLGNYDNIFCFTHLFNSPSWRHVLSADIPVGKSDGFTLRVSYIADFYQSEINELRTHIYSHTFSLGFVKMLYKAKRNDSLIKYTPF